MLRVPLLVLTVLVVAFVGGVWSSLWALEATRGFGGLSVNGWIAYPDIQTAEADPYAKAHRANDGQLLFGRAEGLIFRANVDQDGQALDARCDYMIKGRVPPALFWTLRITYPDRKDSVKIPQYWPTSLNAHRTLHRQDGSISIALSARAAPGNWIALAEDGPFALQLTLIDTPGSNDSGIRALNMPSIVRGACR